PSIDKAYVTRGGVSLKEVDRKTMQSRLVPGLYILGEALDIDGISGGYNLQACMSEAYLAVKDILGI
ncbi:MAG: NAD(P)/FAD-dependent oxidoreductase, partial [Clostridiales bacterium]|nr:NAD(P)/FAD-dependent oxidoreductase [Clostridiales bacterium]